MPRRVSVSALLVGVCAVTLSWVQAPDALLQRWVGTYQGRAMHLDFYGDTMLVVDDEVPLSFEVEETSLRAWGDTSFTVSFWFAMDRLLLQTNDGAVITMARQDRLARPMEGLWLGAPIGSDDLIEITLNRGGIARWRGGPQTTWSPGEWDRASRVITFTWEADSTQWIGRYDAEGGALLFSEAFEGSGTVILRRVFRR